MKKMIYLVLVIFLIMVFALISEKYIIVPIALSNSQVRIFNIEKRIYDEKKREYDEEKKNTFGKEITRVKSNPKSGVQYGNVNYQYDSEGIRIKRRVKNQFLYHTLFFNVNIRFETDKRDACDDKCYEMYNGKSYKRNRFLSVKPNSYADISEHFNTIESGKYCGVCLNIFNVELKKRNTVAKTPKVYIKMRGAKITKAFKKWSIKPPAIQALKNLARDDVIRLLKNEGNDFSLKILVFDRWLDREVMPNIN